MRRYWESALERDSSDPDEQSLGYRMSSEPQGSSGSEQSLQSLLHDFVARALGTLAMLTV